MPAFGAKYIFVVHLLFLWYSVPFENATACQDIGLARRSSERNAHKWLWPRLVMRTQDDRFNSSFIIQFGESIACIPSVVGICEVCPF